ncbi:MAG: chloride channel protein [Gemmatimonadetes bacterium]|nr:chloride channel protein [Gemmatimonadota bacterium]
MTFGIGLPKALQNGEILRRLRLRLRRSTTAGPLALATTIGLLTGVAAIGLRWMISGVQWLFFDQAGRFIEVSTPLPAWVPLVLAPAVGMVLVSWIVRRWAPEAQGHGIPEVQFAVRQRGGRIRPRVAIVKALASALSIGSGGSVGREGPIVQIGSSIGSTIGQVAGLGASEVRIMVAAGAGAAIGGTFSAPIAGVLFAMEVILGGFASRSFGLVVVSSVAATAVVQSVLGTEPSFSLVEQFTLVSNWEFGLYLGLGVITGIVALVYVWMVYQTEERFELWAIPFWAKALLGGLAVGAIGAFGSPHIFGVGHEGVELALAGALGVGTMAMLVILKILATSITLGAGGSGGVFAPALFIGAMTGGVFGSLMGLLFPTVTASPGAYALVGAAAVFGAAAHAPMTAIVILFEMTDNYRIILPLMLAVVLAQIIASRLNPDSIYSIKLRRLGGFRPSQGEMGTLDILLVADAMEEEVKSVPESMGLDQLAELVRDEHARSWVVLNEEERLVGIVALADLERSIVAGGSEETVGDIMTTAVETTFPAETLRDAFGRFSALGAYQMPVVDPEDRSRVVGVLKRAEMIWAFKELADEHQRLLKRTQALPPDAGGDSVHVALEVGPSHTDICFRPIREIKVPPQALIALLRRGDRVVVPRGFTRVEPGDVLTFITTRRHRSTLEAWIATTTRGPVRSEDPPSSSPG